MNYDAVTKETNKYGSNNNESGMLRMRSLGRDIICPINDKTLKEFCVKGSTNSTTEWPQTGQLLLGKYSVMTLDGTSNQHKQIRKVLNPLFLRNDQLYSRFDTIIHQTQQFINTLIDNTVKSNDDYLNIYPLAKLWSWNAALSILFGNK